METWMVEVVGGVAKCQICRKVLSPVILSVIDFVIVFVGRWLSGAYTAPAIQ